MEAPQLLKAHTMREKDSKQLASSAITMKSLMDSPYEKISGLKNGATDFDQKYEKLAE